ncbi:MAG: OmpA family protein, partial [Pseudomonadota bacterium]
AMRWLGVWTVLLVLIAPATGRGQTFEGDQGFAVERYRMSFDDGGILSVEGAEVGRHLSWNLGLWLGAADDPLVLNRRETDGSDTRIGDLVDQRIGGSLSGSLGLYDWFQIGIEAPVIVYQTRPDTIDGVTAPLPALQSFGFGAPRLAVKIRVLREEDWGLGLALIPAMTLPASSLGSYLGDDVLVFTPDVSVAKSIGPVRLAGNIGYRAKSTGRLLNISINDELLARFGAGIRLEELNLAPVGIDVGVSVATSSNKILQRDVQDHIELLSGLQYDFDGPLLAFAGAGIGLQRGYGTPDWRVFAGLRINGLLERGRSREVVPIIVPTVCCRAATTQPAPPEVAEIPVPNVVPRANEEASRTFIEKKKLLLSTVVYFATDSAMLNRAGIEELATFVAEIYSAGTPLQVQIIGHTDSRNSTAYNMALSMGRSQAVRRTLIKFGVPTDVIRTLGRGLDEPVAPNGTPSGRRMNRRAEVRAIVEQPRTLRAARPPEKGAGDEAEGILNEANGGGK